MFIQVLRLCRYFDCFCWCSACLGYLDRFGVKVVLVLRVLGLCRLFMVFWFWRCLDA